MKVLLFLPFQTQPFLGDFHYVWKLGYNSADLTPKCQMKDMDCVDIQIKFFLKISFENVKKSEVEKPIFQRGGHI